MLNHDADNADSANATQSLRIVGTRTYRTQALPIRYRLAEIARPACFGERGVLDVLDVVTVLSYYSLIAISMKTFAQKPESVRDPFAG